SAPVAAALIIDNGPTMLYRAGNEQRFDAAKEMGQWILEQLPQESRVGILADAPLGSLALDPSTAESQLKIITTRGAHVDLPGKIRTALELVLASELERKEIYVLTDLMSASWTAAQPDLIQLLDEHREQVLLQIIDIGSAAAANYRLGDAAPDASTVPAGGEVAIDVSVHRTADASPQTLTVELIQEQIDERLPLISDGRLQLPPQRIVDRQVVELNTESSTNVQLRARELAPGTHNFTIRLDKPDPLTIDNERYLSVLSQAQKPTLIVANDAALAQVLTAIVDPGALGKSSPEETHIDPVRYAQLSGVPLENYAVVCLFDPPPLTAAVVQSLDNHVRGGGGLLLILGPGLGPLESIQGNPFTKLLPGELAAVAQRQRSQATVFPQPLALSHAVFFAFEGSPDQVLWNLYPVYRNWTFSSLADDAMTLMKLSDSSAPLLTAQNRGRGQILTFTTPLPEVESREREVWNLMWATSDPWPAFALLLGAFRSLSGANQEQLNYEVGQLVSLSNDPLTWPSRYDLYTPDAQLRRVSSNDEALPLGEFQQAGIYRLRGQRTEPLSRAFSVNVPAADTVLDRLSDSDLEQRLGRGNYRIARDQSEVESSVGQARFGRELYPLLMVLVAGLFLAEQAMSNRFYKIKLGRGLA
ncbi:MAG: VWA domain-containing protein, partial [Planctomycetales bacterium]|nr:VWA domain-containing protein [Planctomycetales bacterium]